MPNFAQNHLQGWFFAFRRGISPPNAQGRRMNRLALAVLPDVYSEKAGMNPAFPHIIISLIVLVFEDGLPHIQNIKYIYGVSIREK